MTGGVGVIDSVRMSDNDIVQELRQANSMAGGLFRLRDCLKPYGVGQLIYSYMLHEKSFVRNDLVFQGTFEGDMLETFNQHGGVTAYKFGDMLPNMKEPVYYDLEAALSPNHPLFSYNKATAKAVEWGYKICWIVPFLSLDNYGFGFMMMYQDKDEGAATIEIDKLAHFGALYHHVMWEEKLLAKQFNVSAKEAQTLDLIAKGFSTYDVAEKLGVTERAIEFRLQNARKKLKAKTAAEAIYKATAYLILPYRPAHA